MKYKIIKQNKHEIELEEITDTIQEIPSKKLRWGEVSSKVMNWNDAKLWCEKQGGRLPTLVELLQAFEDGTGGFKDDVYWSATTYKYDTAFAWRVNFNFGFVNGNNRSTYLFYARCVREL